MMSASTYQLFGSIHILYWYALQKFLIKDAFRPKVMQVYSTLYFYHLLIIFISLKMWDAVRSGVSDMDNVIECESLHWSLITEYLGVDGGRYV